MVSLHGLEGVRFRVEGYGELGGTFKLANSLMNRFSYTTTQEISNYPKVPPSYGLKV